MGVLSTAGTVAKVGLGLVGAFTLASIAFGAPGTGAALMAGAKAGGAKVAALWHHTVA